MVPTVAAAMPVVSTAVATADPRPLARGGAGRTPDATDPHGRPEAQRVCGTAGLDRKDDGAGIGGVGAGERDGPGALASHHRRAERR